MTIFNSYVKLPEGNHRKQKGQFTSFPRLWLSFPYVGFTEHITFQIPMHIEYVILKKCTKHVQYFKV